MHSTFFYIVVGGIYTVLQSKAQTTVKELGSNYCMVGIANQKFVATEVDELEPDCPYLRKTVEILREKKVRVSSISTLI